MRGDGRTFSHRGTDDNRVPDDDRCGMNSDFAGFQIDLLVVALDGANLQINDAVFAERVDHRAVLRVQRNEPVTRRDVQHSVVDLAVRPIGDTSPR